MLGQKSVAYVIVLPVPKSNFIERKEELGYGK